MLEGCNTEFLCGAAGDGAIHVSRGVHGAVGDGAVHAGGSKIGS